MELRVSAGGIGLVVVIAIMGTVLFIHRRDAEGSARIANSEVELMLQRGGARTSPAPRLRGVVCVSTVERQSFRVTDVLRDDAMPARAR